ncbi:MAG TPA: IPT/TIG domain-containing protein [Terriglobales bacterium]|nr:IPT/TIG domain-containing protein [Terriglobales bacterium]
MRKVCIFLAGLFLAVGIAGCGYGSNTMISGAIPNVTQLSPMAVMHGAASFGMTVSGNNFGMDSVVFFNGNALQTAYGSAVQVTAQVPAADVANSAMVNVYVRSGNQNSNIVLFTIQ